jgi:uncharacterized protein
MTNRSIMLAVLLMTALIAHAQNKNFIDLPYLETTAQVDTLVTPDRIYFDILISERDTKGKISVEELENKMEATLKNIGIDTEKDLVLSDLATNFSRYFLKSQDIIKAKIYSLLVRDAATAAKVIVSLEEIGVSNVSINRTESSRFDEIALAMKAVAIRKAKQNADIMAKELRQKLGPAIYISDRSESDADAALRGHVAGIRLRGTGAVHRASPYEPADIEFDKIKIASFVEVRFKLE